MEELYNPDITEDLNNMRTVDEHTEGDMHSEGMEEVEEILRYKFKNRDLLVEALTHHSFYPSLESGISYERLEFVGDSVINCLVAREFFSSYKHLPPGPLTRLRAANVDTERLARICVHHKLYCHLRHTVPLLNEQIQYFIKEIMMYPIHSNGLLDPPKVLADIVESLLGAIFMDSDSSLETVWKTFKKLADPLISPEMLGRHPVSELFELCQKKKMDLRFLKDMWAENTMVEVLVDGNLVGSATYSNKKEIAINRAAKAALDRLKEEFDELEDLNPSCNPACNPDDV